MERELWKPLYQIVRQVGRQVKQKGVTFQPWIVALVVLWAALHDRPRNWACDMRNWSPTTCCPIQLPSESVISRRADSIGMGVFWRMVEVALRGSNIGSLISFMDGKPLFVGGFTKDPDARKGYGAGLIGKGYKLHALWSGRALLEAWDVTPLNKSENVVAGELLKHTSGGGYLLTDGNYDTNPLNNQAGREGYQLVSKNRRANAGKGHHRQSPYRQRSIELRNHSFGEELLNHRYQIEQFFGNTTTFAGGLAPLPAWVRRIKRVRTWVWCKLLINAVRIRLKQGLTTQMQFVGLAGG
jgi:hypothetical protein